MGRILIGFTLAIVGMGAHAELMVSPPDVNFYNVPLNSYGQSSTVYVENESSAIVTPSVMNACAEAFQVTNMCEFNLDPGQSCTIEIRFSPSILGFESCSIWVSDTTGDQQSISVSGQGI